MAQFHFAAADREYMTLSLTVISTVPSQRAGPGFESISRLGPLWVEFACSPRARMGSLRVLWHSPKTCLLGVNW